MDLGDPCGELIYPCTEEPLVLSTLSSSLVPLYHFSGCYRRHRCLKFQPSLKHGWGRGPCSDGNYMWDVTWSFRVFPRVRCLTKHESQKTRSLSSKSRTVSVFISTSFVVCPSTKHTEICKSPSLQLEQPNCTVT